MPKYLTDKTYTCERIRELQDAVTYAQYELAAAVKVARPLGVSYTDLQRAMGFSSKSGAQSWVNRLTHLQELPDEEVERLCRLLGIGDRASRYEVRVIVSGKPGISKVVRQTISGNHLHQHVAEERALARGEGAEVWRVDPDGTATQLQIRPPHTRDAARARAAARSASSESDDDETPF